MTLNGTALTLAGGSYAGAIVGAGSVALSGPTTLSGSSAVALTVNNAASLYVGAGTLSLSGGLTLANASILGFGFNGTTSSAINLQNSALVLSAGTETISLSGTVTSTGTYVLLSGATGGITGGGTLSLNTAGLIGTGYNYALQTVTGSGLIDLVVTSAVVASGQLTWTASQSHIWDTSSLNFTDSGTLAAAAFTNGNSVTFSAVGAGAVTVTNSGAAVQPSSVTVVGASAYTFTGDPIGGSASLTMNGGSTLALFNANSYSGGTAINSGTVLINSASSLGTGAVTLGGAVLEATATISSTRAITLNNAGSAIQVDGGATYTLGGTISGSGGLNATGAGTLVVSGANSYTGGTTISGVLNAMNASALGTGGVSVLAGATLAPVSSLTLSSGLILNSGATLAFSNLGGVSGQIDLLGSITNLTLSAGTETISLAGSISSTGSYTLISYGSGTYSGALSQLLLNETNLTLANGLTATLSDNTALHEIDLLVSTVVPPTGALTWSGAVSHVWDTSTFNFTDSGTMAATAFANGNTVTFTDVGAGTVTVSNGGTPLHPASVTITNSAAYTFTGDGLTSTGALTKQGSGSLFLANAESYSGVVVTSGSLEVGAAGSLSTPTLSIGVSGRAIFDAAISITTVTDSGNLAFSTTGTIAALTGAGGITTSGALTVNSGSFSGPLSGAGSLTVSGGTFSYSGINNITGGVTITGGGTLAVAVQTALGANAISLSGGTLHVTGNIDESSAHVSFATGGTINIDSGMTLTLTGANITGNITQTGAGTLDILGDYGGTTTVGAGGTLMANPASAGSVVLSTGSVLDFTSAGSYGGNVTVSSSPGFAVIENTSGGVVTLSGTIDKTHANLALSGPGNFWVNGTITGGTVGTDFNSDMLFNGGGTTTFSTQQSWVGPTTISGGSTVYASGVNNALPASTILNLGDASNTTGSYNLGGNTQTLAGIVTWGSGTSNSITSSAAGGQLFVNVASGVDSYSGSLTGSLGLHKEGSGTLELTGSSNSYNGATAIDVGTLQLGVNAALPTTTTVSLAGGGILDVNGHTQQIASLESASSTATVTGSAGSVLNVSHSAAISSIYAGVVSGQMSMAFNGVALGAEVLTGTANNYSGSTTINSGALIVNGSITGTGSSVTVNSTNANNPGVLAGNNTSGSINRDVVIASGSGSGGVISPGNVAPNISSPTSTALAGELNIGGNLSVAGTYLWDLASNSTTGAGSNFDQITLNSGSVTGAGGTLELVLTGAGVPSNTAFWQTYEQWAVITGAGTINSLFSLLDQTAGNYSSLGSFSLAGLTTDQAAGAVLLDWNPTAVPEPGTMLFASLASLGLGGFSWRKRKTRIAGTHKQVELRQVEHDRALSLKSAR